MVNLLVHGAAASEEPSVRAFGKVTRARLGALMLGCVLVLLLVIVPHDLPLVWVCNLATATLGGVLLVVLWCAPRSIWSISVVYLAIFSLFHFGMTSVYGFGLPISEETLVYMDEWFFTSVNQDAILLASIGVVACGLGILSAWLGRTQALPVPDTPNPIESIAVRVGALLLMAGVVGWLVLALRDGGIGIIFGGYETFLAATDDNALMPLTYYGINLGLTLLAAAPPSRLRRFALLPFVAWVLIALPLGLRGEVLFPMMAALAVAAKRRVPLSMGKAVLGGIALLCVIALIREVRADGLSGISASHAESGNPLDALTELGSSLRPVAEVVYWQQTGDEFIYGASYWAPIGRIVERIVPAWNMYRVSGDVDDRLMNQLAIRRVAAIGFSPIAEAYRNFGVSGVVGWMFAMGLLLGRMDIWPATRERQILSGVLLVPLLVEVRNDFIAVPFQIALGVAVLGMCMYIARRQRVDGMSNGRAHYQSFYG